MWRCFYMFLACELLLYWFWVFYLELIISCFYAYFVFSHKFLHFTCFHFQKVAKESVLRMDLGDFFQDFKIPADRWSFGGVGVVVKHNLQSSCHHLVAFTVYDLILWSKLSAIIIMIFKVSKSFQEMESLLTFIVNGIIKRWRSICTSSNYKLTLISQTEKISQSLILKM